MDRFFNGLLEDTTTKTPLVVEVEGSCGPLRESGSETILISRSNVTLRGVGKARVCGAASVNDQECAPATTTPDRELVLVRITDATDVVVENLVFENYWTKDPGRDAIAISVQGAKRVLIQGNTVRKAGVDWASAYGALTTDQYRSWWKERSSDADDETHYDGRYKNPEDGGNIYDPTDFGASAIKLWGACDVTVLDNDISGLRLGFSEAIAIVDGSQSFSVFGNRLTHLDNIGIDVRGDAEGISQHGVICQNVLSEFRCGNPAYGNPAGETTCAQCARDPNNVPGDVDGPPWCDCHDPSGLCYGRRPRRPSAGGIYVDGGKNVLISGNYVAGWDYGVQVSSEEAVPPVEGVVVEENELFENGTRSPPWALHEVFSEREEARAGLLWSRNRLERERTRRTASGGEDCERRS